MNADKFKNETKMFSLFIFYRRLSAFIGG